METIDMTPTWAEVTRMYTRFAESGERRACAGMSSEIIRAGKSADALNALLPTLTDEQAAIVRKVLK